MPLLASNIPYPYSLPLICFKNLRTGTSLVVQWLRLMLPMQGVRVQSLVGELKSHMPCDVAKNYKKKKKNLCTARFENLNSRPLDFPSLSLPITFVNLSLGNFFMRWQRIGSNRMNLNWVNYQGKEETKHFLPNPSLSSLPTHAHRFFQFLT